MNLEGLANSWGMDGSDATEVDSLLMKSKPDVSWVAALCAAKLASAAAAWRASCSAWRRTKRAAQEATTTSTTTKRSMYRRNGHPRDRVGGAGSSESAITGSELQSFFDARKQVEGREGLGQVKVRPREQPGFDVALLRLRGEEDHVRVLEARILLD